MGICFEFCRSGFSAHFQFKLEANHPINRSALRDSCNGESHSMSIWVNASKQGRQAGSSKNPAMAVRHGVSLAQFKSLIASQSPCVVLRSATVESSRNNA